MGGSDETDPEVLADAEAVDADWSIVEDEYPPDGPVPAPLDGPMETPARNDPAETEEVQPEWMPPQPPLGATSLFDLGAVGWQSGSLEYVPAPEPSPERRTRRGPPKVPTDPAARPSPPRSPSSVRHPGGAPSGAGPAKGQPIGSRLRASRAPAEPEPSPPRSYPKLLAKLTGEPEAARTEDPASPTRRDEPLAIGPTSGEPEVVVPELVEGAEVPPSATRTFFPAPKFPPVVPDAPIGRNEYVEGGSRSRSTAEGPDSPSPADLDGLLTEMAEGLLIGTSPTGGTQVRLTLNDEFLAGTEIVLEVKDKKVHAEFIPPDRQTYWRIEPESARLADMLEARGLRVQELTVRFPPL